MYNKQWRSKRVARVTPARAAVMVSPKPSKLNRSISHLFSIPALKMCAQVCSKCDAFKIRGNVYTYKIFKEGRHCQVSHLSYVTDNMHGCYDKNIWTTSSKIIQDIRLFYLIIKNFFLYTTDEKNLILSKI